MYVFFGKSHIHTTGHNILSHKQNLCAIELVLPVIYAHHTAYGQKTIDSKFLIGAGNTLKPNESYYIFSGLLPSSFMRKQAMVSSCKQVTSKILHKCKNFNLMLLEPVATHVKDHTYSK